MHLLPALNTLVVYTLALALLYCLPIFVQTLCLIPTSRYVLLPTSHGNKTKIPETHSRNIYHNP